MSDLTPSLLLLLLSLPSILARPSEHDALLRLEFLVSSWTPNHHCSWRGVSCDSRSRVTSIRLPSSSVRFHGTLSPSIGQLHALRVLALPFLGLREVLPPEVAEMESLEVLDLRGNSLQGPLPARFGRRLRILMLGFNRFSGAIPLGLRECSELELLDLSHNRLGGGIPRWLGGMCKLKELYLSSNRFVGPIPQEVGERCGCLERVELAGYGLIGGIPGNIAQLRKLRSLESFSPSGNIQGRSFESTEGLPPPGKASGFSSIGIASISSAAAIVSVLFALVIIYICTRKCTPKVKVEPEGKKEITIFVNINAPLTYEIVVRATGNFNASNCIGSGGFGATYKAEIAPGVIVAIKRLFVGKTQGVQQFHAEIKTLGRWRHPNLVTLIGFHISEAEMFLIYNYLPGGNLEKFINTRKRRPVDWRVLHKIALDIACALAYLHDQCVPRILHRDVKPSNILLDNDFNAYLSDFGLARLLGNSQTHATTDVAGAFGYVDPDYAMTCRVSDKADVYSYGVVLLELLSDKKALDPSFFPYGNGFNIVNWASMMFKNGKAREFFMDGLWGAAPSDDVIGTLRLALQCTVDTPTNRPSMTQVVRHLKNIHP